MIRTERSLTSENSKYFFVILLLMLSLTLIAQAQQKPVALPYTITTYAGGVSAKNGASPTVCTTTPSGGAPTGNYGDGCLATQGNLSTDLRALAVDGYGNMYIADNGYYTLRKVDRQTGIISVAAFPVGGTACSNKQDKMGDGCPAAQTSSQNAVGMRGLSIDPYGNVVMADYKANVIHMLCNTASGACSSIPVGSVILVAGTTQDTGHGTLGCGGTKNSTGAWDCGDGGPAVYPGTTAAPGSTNTTSSNGFPEMTAPRGAAADKFGNVFIADTGDNRVRVVPGVAALPDGTPNPVYDLIKMNPALSSVNIKQGYIYPLARNVQMVNGNVQNPTVCANALDAGASSLGNGCPYYQAVVGRIAVPTTGYEDVVDIALDKDGDILVVDSGNSQIRVIYMGGAKMANLIKAENPTLSGNPVVGSIYFLAGGGTTGTAYAGAPASGITTTISLQKLAIDSEGNIYFSDAGNGTGNPGHIWFLDVQTGYVRQVAGNSTTCGNVATGSTQVTPYLGDNGPATAAQLCPGGGGMGIAIDQRNNVYFSDGVVLGAGFNGNPRIRVISSLNLPTTAVGSSSPATTLLHFGAGDTPSSASTPSGFGDVAVGSANCATNGDNTTDCTYPVTFSPVVPGLRQDPLIVNTTLGSSASIGMTGTGTGAAFAFDVQPPAVPNSAMVGMALTPAALAVDAGGNVYVVDGTSNSVVRMTASGASSSVSNSLPSGASGIAVDGAGQVFVVGTGASAIEKFAPAGLSLGIPTYASSTLNVVGVTQPKAIAVDNGGSLYVADNASGNVYKASPDGAQSMVFASGFTGVFGLALDNAGNLYVADQKGIYKITPAGTKTTVNVGGASPAAIAVDVAGNLYIQDAASGQVFEVPVSGAQSAIYGGVTSPAGVAVDGSGNLYVADASKGSIVEVTRSQQVHNFGSDTTTQLPVTVTNIGNVSYTGTLQQTDTTDFSVVPGGSSPCSFTSFAPGSACTETAQLLTSSASRISDVVSFNPAVANFAQLALHGGTLATTTTITGPSPATPVYLGPLSFTVKVSAAGEVPTGTVSITVDGTATNYTLDSTGQATVDLSALHLTAGVHSISASYPGSTGYAASTAASQPFTVDKATPSLSWAPTATTQQFSVAIGGGVLNVSANGVAGTFAYTATPNGGTASPITAASYLAVGTYTLDATFTPTDSANYGNATSSISNYQVTKGDTTAALGAVLTSDVTGYVPNGSALTITQGQSVSVVLRVTGPGAGGIPGGAYVMNTNGSVLNSGSLDATGFARYATSSLAPGTYTLTSSYAGDASFNASTSNTFTLTVVAASATPTTTSLVLTPSSPTYGQPLTATANVTGSSGTPTGSVVFNVDGVDQPAATLNGGFASLLLGSNLSAGNHAISASYSGDPLNGSSTANGSVTIAKAPVALTVLPATKSYGAALPSFLSMINGAQNGDVLSATYTTTATSSSPVGNYAVSAQLTGAAASNYTAILTAGNLTVTPVALTVTIADMTAPYGTTTPAFTVANVTGLVNGDALGSTLAVTYQPTATPTSAPGTYSVSGTVSGSAAGNYTSAVNPGKFVVTKASSVSTVTASATILQLGQSVTLTAKLTSATTGTPTGNVSFMSGATVLATVALNSSGVATYTSAPTSLSVGDNHVSVSYPGDTNFAPSTSTPVDIKGTLAPDFTLTANPSSLMIARGSSATITLALTPVNQYQGTVRMSCGTLPANVTCNFQPQSWVVPSTASGMTLTGTLTISTGKSNSAALFGNSSRMFAAILYFPMGLVGILAVSDRKRSKKRIMMLAVLMLLAIASMTGCGGGSSSAVQSITNTQVVITAGDSNANLSHSVNFNVTIQ